MFINVVLAQIQTYLEDVSNAIRIADALNAKMDFLNLFINAINLFGDLFTVLIILKLI